jgi:hypothetical protein
MAQAPPLMNERDACMPRTFNGRKGLRAVAEPPQMHEMQHRRAAAAPKGPVLQHFCTRSAGQSAWRQSPSFKRLSHGRIRVHTGSQRFGTASSPRNATAPLKINGFSARFTFFRLRTPHVP